MDSYNSITATSKYKHLSFEHYEHIIREINMKINQIHKFYGDEFSSIFRSITFDNGSEFSRYRDIEYKCGTKTKRTSVYFGRPYHSCDRASNENCNGLIRRFIKKGTDIDTIRKDVSTSINIQINRKKRRILNYSSAEDSFLNELSILGLINALCLISFSYFHFLLTIRD